LTCLQLKIVDKRIRRSLIDAITERTPTGAGQGQRNAKKSRRVDKDLAIKAVIEGASKEVCSGLGIPRNGHLAVRIHFIGDMMTLPIYWQSGFDTLLQQEVFKISTISSVNSDHMAAETTLVSAKWSNW